MLSSDETTGVLSKYLTFISVTVLPPIGLKWNTSTSNANLTSPRECHYLSYPTRNGRPSARTWVYATWKTMVFLQNGNVDIARSGGLSPEPCSPRCTCARVCLCTYEDPVFLAHNVPVWNSYRSLGRAIRLSRLKL